MNNYLLKNEKKKIENITKDLSKSINVKPEELDNIKKQFYTIIENCKDASIEDILEYYTRMLINEIKPLLENNITPGLQVGIKNDYFQINTYGGKYNKYSYSKDIEENTMFSFDSISKLITSTITMQEINNNNFTLNTNINEINKDFTLNTSIESILKFTAMIRTEKRIENLSLEETIEILKKCKENLIEKNNYKNFYEYNDIGYMILRLSINNFLTKLNNFLKIIDKNNLTYQNIENKDNITGGKISEEYFTPDKKGREIPFPGHTGLYGNINGLLNMFYQIIYTENIINKYDKEILFKQPYKNPKVYNKDGSQKMGQNQSPQYMAKIAGIYRKPNGITDNNYNKLASCDMSNKTTNASIASAGTCGSWVTGDNLNYNNKFGTYVSGLLSNPYSLIENTTFKEKTNNIPNSPLQVTSNGIIIGYHKILNKYKEIITNYSLLLELITEYIKEIDNNALEKTNKKLIKKIV